MRFALKSVLPTAVILSLLLCEVSQAQTTQPAPPSAQVVQQLIDTLRQKLNTITTGIDSNYTELDGPNGTGLTETQVSNSDQENALDKKIVANNANWTDQINAFGQNLSELGGNSKDATSKATDIASLLNSLNMKEEAAENAYVTALSQEATGNQIANGADVSPQVQNSNVQTNIKAFGRIFGMVGHSDHTRTAHHNHDDAKKLAKQAEDAFNAYGNVVTKTVSQATVSGSPNDALQSAATYGSVPLVFAAVAAGADVNVRDGSGMTPLMLAAAKGNEMTVHALLDEGANATLATPAGQTAVALASTAGIRNTIQQTLGGSVAVAANDSSSASEPHPYGGKEIPYSISGPYADVVKHLLDGAPPWRTPSSNTREGMAGMQAPQFPDLAGYGQRDQYVAAAIVQAFGAESYARLGDTDHMNNYAATMMKNLQAAYTLCSGSEPLLSGRNQLATAYVTCAYLSGLSSAGRFP